MVKTELDRQLQELYLNDWNEDFISFASDVVKGHLVAINLINIANRYEEFLEDALIVFSGYKSELSEGFADMARIMVQQELRSGRWASMPADVLAAADVIAHRAWDGMNEAGTDEEDPEKLYLVLGLYCYATVASCDWFDAGEFLKLFVAAWFIYYGDVLSVEHNGCDSKSGIPS